MSAFVVADLDVFDPEKYEMYKHLVPATLELYGGRYLARGGKVEALDGTWTPARLVIIEFPSIEKAKAWANSPEYAKAKAIRHETAHSRIIVVEGL